MKISLYSYIDKLLCSVLMLLYIGSISAQTNFSFDSIRNKKPILQTVFDQHQKYKLQIIYTQIIRDANGKPTFRNYTYQLDSANYFYCASLVKLPCSIIALEKLNELKIERGTTMFTDSANACQHSVKKDPSSKSTFPTIENYIKRMFLVSDNFAYGRVYEFLGVDYLHNRLAELGYNNVRIINRFDGDCKGTDHITTNPVSFYNDSMKLIYHQKQQVANGIYKNPLGSVKVGKAYMNAQNKKINEPKDFTNMNYMSLQNIHTMLQHLVFNLHISKEKQYKITEDDQDFLLRYLTMYPGESFHPTYNSKYHDSYKKYFIFGDSKKPITDSDIKITNIVGQSYGFMVDCAYIQNKTKNVEFMLSAVVYTNENEIINDGKYEYNTIALPFLAELGRQIYNYELKKK